MTDHERRIVLSTMRIAASVMTAGGAITRRYCPPTALRSLKHGALMIVRLQEFQQLVHDINAAIAVKYPDMIAPKGD
jgi:hypothetical protein